MTCKTSRRQIRIAKSVREVHRRFRGDLVDRRPSRPPSEGIGSALMNALLSAADAQDVPLVVLLGSPQYYGRFGFRPAVELDLTEEVPRVEPAFEQAA